MKRDIFLRLPQPTALLLLSAILELSSAHMVYPLPRQTQSSPQPTTTTIAHHAIDAVPFPTSPPRLTAEILRRQELNTICGYIGGDPNLPATCSLGSHCVLDTQHGAIGCCPDNEPACTTGIFTACVDGNSPPQTEVNPYVFTCEGGDVCYQNVFEGGFYQYGCGTASDLATSVLATATGITETLDRPSLTFSFTESADTLTAPTTLAMVTVPSSTGAPSSSVTPLSVASTTSSAATSQSSSSESSPVTSSTTSRSASSSSSTSASSTTSPTSSSASSSSTTSSTTSSSTTSSSPSTSPTSSQTSSETTTLTSPTSNLITSSATSEPTDTGSKSHNHTGAIVGGTITGVAVLIAAILLGLYLWRRKKRVANAERLGSHSTGGGGPGGPTAYVSPMSGAPPHSGGYAPAYQDQEDWETGMPPPASMAAAGGTGLPAGSRLYPGDPYPPARTGYDYPSSHYPAGYGVGAGSSAAGAAGGIYGGIPPPRPDRGLYEPEAEAADQVPLTREIDDFSRGFHDALGRIGEEDEYDSSPNNSGTGVNEGNGVNGPGGASRGDSDDAIAGPYNGVRPLWQQQRRQSRNLMWM